MSNPCAAASSSIEVLEQALSTLNSEFANALSRLELPHRVEGLYEPIRYALASGGKRIRPLLALISAEGCGADIASAMPAALAVEVFHNFTLLHDDLMDHADTRRGRPTVVARWGVNTAVLSGDAMLSLATLLAAGVPDGPRLLNDAAMGVYEGQQLDMDMEGQPHVSEADYMEMIRLKTSVLLGAACTLGAAAAHADDATAHALYTYGEKLGLAFQLRDDLLDTFGDPATFGKAIGGDILNDKNTWLRVNLPAGMRPDPSLEGQAKINAWREAYSQAGLPGRCEQLIEDFTRQAIDALPRGLAPQPRRLLEHLAQKAATRNV